MQSTMTVEMKRQLLCVERTNSCVLCVCVRERETYAPEPQKHFVNCHCASQAICLTGKFFTNNERNGCNNREDNGQDIWTR